MLWKETYLELGEVEATHKQTLIPHILLHRLPRTNKHKGNAKSVAAPNRRQSCTVLGPTDWLLCSSIQALTRLAFLLWIWFHTRLLAWHPAHELVMIRDSSPRMVPLLPSFQSELTERHQIWLTFCRGATQTNSLGGVLPRPQIFFHYPSFVFAALKAFTCGIFTPQSALLWVVAAHRGFISKVSCWITTKSQLSPDVSFQEQNENFFKPPSTPAK